jgi:hypothetical protein
MKKTDSIQSVFFMEGPVGLEPTTRGLKGRCSNQLSYGPACINTGNLTPYIICFLAEKST